MENLKDSNYVMLGKEFCNLYKKLEEETLNLKEKIFGEANKKLRIYEKEIEEEFLDVWNKYGNPKIIFNNFKICLNPQSNQNYSLVKTLTSNDKKLDLEKIALEISEKERKHDRLVLYKEYEKIREKIAIKLKEEKLYFGWSNIKQIHKFQKRFNLLTFEPEYYK